MNLYPLALLSLGLALSFGPAQAEQQCFQYDKGPESGALVLDLPSGDGPVSGMEQGTVQDHEQGYFTSWETRITGRRSGNTLKVRLEIKIEEDNQIEQQTWRIEQGAILTDRHRYEPSPCDGDGGDAPTGYDEVPEHGADDISRGHCLEGEEVVFSCEIGEGDDVLSVCLSDDSAGLAYRFGPVVQPELEYPKGAAGSLAKFVIHTIGYSGGYDTRLGFTSGAFHYQIYERMISRGPNAGKDMESGVVIYKNRKEIANLPCSTLGESGAGLGQLMDLVTNKPFFDEEGMVE
jgi:hypothetical protein